MAFIYRFDSTLLHWNRYYVIFVPVGTSVIGTSVIKRIRIRIFYCQFCAHKGQTRIHIKIEIPN